MTTDQHASPLDDFLTEDQAAARLGVTVTTMRCWAARRKGPARIKAGRKPLYRASAIVEWLNRHETDPEAS